MYVDQRLLNENVDSDAVNQDAVSIIHAFGSAIEFAAEGIFQTGKKGQTEFCPEVGGIAIPCQ